jgi:hypothetical protein
MKIVEGLANRLEVPAGKRDILVFDDDLPGFFIRKFESGKASYGVKYNVGRQQRRLTLGVVVPGVLREMRKKASDVLARALREGWQGCASSEQEATCRVFDCLPMIGARALTS